MNKTSKYGLLIAFAVIVSLLLFLFAPSGNDDAKKIEGSTNGKTQVDATKQIDQSNEDPVRDSMTKEQLDKAKAAQSQNKLQRIQQHLKSDYSTPIDFWGKVVDQEGNPIAGVKAEITVDGYLGNKTHTTHSSDEGLFELLNKKGARVRVKISKDGYAPTSNKTMGTNVSARTIYYAGDVMPNYAPPTKDNPQVFVLRKKKPIANISYAAKKRVSVSKTGEAKKVTLKTKGENIEFEVRCWSSSPTPFTYDKYDWKAEIKIVGGKIQVIENEEAIEAPMAGYLEFYELDMPKDAQKWKASNVRNKDFWIQFDGGTYAKARVEVKTGRKHQVDAEVWFNVDGINNFEK